MAGKNGTQEITVENGVLIIRMPLGKGTLSSTGKSLVVASTGGFKPIEGTEYRVNLTAIKKAA